MGLTLRETKGSALTYAEMDANFTFLSSSLSSSATPTGSFTGSFTGSLSGSLIGSLSGSATGSFTGSYTGSMTGSFTGSLQGTSSFSITASFTVGGIKLTPSNSIIVPTTSSVPTYTGTEGEILPVVSGSVSALYAFLSGSWQQFIPAPKTYSLTLTREQITGSLFTSGITIGSGALGLAAGQGAKFYRDQTTITYNSGATPFTCSGVFSIKQVSGAQVVNTINQGELTVAGATITNMMLESAPYRIGNSNGVYLESSSPITASDAAAFIRVKLFYDIINLNDM